MRGLLPFGGVAVVGWRKVSSVVVTSVDAACLKLVEVVVSGQPEEVVQWVDQMSLRPAAGAPLNTH